MAIDDVVDALRRDEIVVVPTDTVYGLAVRMTAAAVERLFTIKGRQRDKAFAVLVADRAQVAELAAPDPVAAELMRRFWPGPLTIVVRRSLNGGIELGGDPRTVGLRRPDSPWILELAQRVGPLVTTSANVAGEPILCTVQEITEAFRDRLGATLDVGALDGEPSTVVSCIDGALEILRVGPIPFEQVRVVVDGLA